VRSTLRVLEIGRECIERDVISSHTQKALTKRKSEDMKLGRPVGGARNLKQDKHADKIDGYLAVDADRKLTIWGCCCPHTAGRSACPKIMQRSWASSWMQGTPAGLPWSMPGMGEEMEGAVQQAAQPGRQVRVIRFWASGSAWSQGPQLQGLLEAARQLASTKRAKDVCGSVDFIHTGVP
jgi:hypothetical protein